MRHPTGNTPHGINIYIIRQSSNEAHQQDSRLSITTKQKPATTQEQEYVWQTIYQTK